ncbi:Uncharacterised protein g9145 [Pycnogonum litorale]
MFTSICFCRDNQLELLTDN